MIKALFPILEVPSLNIVSELDCLTEGFYALFEHSRKFWDSNSRLAKFSSLYFFEMHPFLQILYVIYIKQTSLKKLLKASCYYHEYTRKSQ